MEHHHHAHAHTHPIDHLNKAFLWGIGLNLSFVAVEFLAGIVLDSMALISDAGHNLSDVVSLSLSLLAFRLAKVKPTTRFTYGYKKSTVLVSLLNACILLVAVGIILAESIAKIRHPQPVEGGAIALVAGVGIVINAFTAWLFLKDKKHDLNVKGAYLHMVADTLVSVGVLISGLVISRTGWYVIDPIIGITVAIVILFSTWGLLRDSLRLSLDGVPAGIDPASIRRFILENEPDIRDIHHIHIWALSTTENAMTAHVVVTSRLHEQLLRERIKHLLGERSIQHATLEFELPDECHEPDCRSNHESDHTHEAH